MAAPLCLVQSQSLHSNFSITVLLLPVGDISPEIFAHYAGAFEQFAVVSMDNLTPPGDYSRVRSAFKYQSWWVPSLPGVLSLFPTGAALLVSVHVLRAACSPVG
jgi:hypothetical protein